MDVKESFQQRLDEETLPAKLLVGAVINKTINKTITKPSPTHSSVKTLIFASCVTCLALYFSLCHSTSFVRRKGSLDHGNEKAYEETGLWLEEIASLITELYDLLSEMRYIKPGAIQYAPHDKAGVNITLATYIGLTPDAITLLQLLPYAVASPGPYYYYKDTVVPSITQFSAWGSNNMLLLSTRFIDLRDDFTLRASRDPWNGGMGLSTDADVHKKEPWTESYLKPWQIALSSSTYDSRLIASNLVGSSVMILDLKTRMYYYLHIAPAFELFEPMTEIYVGNIWTVGHRAVSAITTENNSFEVRGSIDPATYGQYAEGQTGLNNRSRLEIYASRPATTVLKDYINRYRTLEWVPGYGNGSEQYAYGYDSYKALYEKYGWPKQFDGEGFENAMIAWEMHQIRRCRLTDCIWELDASESSMANQRNINLKLKADLAYLRTLDPAIPRKDWNTKMKEYKGWTESEYADEIAQGQQMLERMEVRLRDLIAGEKKVPDWAKNELKELEEKYGKATQYGTRPRFECMWKDTKFNA